MRQGWKVNFMEEGVLRLSSDEATVGKHSLLFFRECGLARDPGARNNLGEKGD